MGRIFPNLLPLCSSMAVNSHEKHCPSLNSTNAAQWFSQLPLEATTRTRASWSGVCCSTTWLCKAFPREDSEPPIQLMKSAISDRGGKSKRSTSCVARQETRISPVAVPNQLYWWHWSLRFHNRPGQWGLRHRAAWCAILFFSSDAIHPFLVNSRDAYWKPQCHGFFRSISTRYDRNNTASLGFEGMVAHWWLWNIHQNTLAVWGFFHYSAPTFSASPRAEIEGAVQRSAPCAPIDDNVVPRSTHNGAITWPALRPAMLWASTKLQVQILSTKRPMNMGVSENVGLIFPMK